MPYRRTIIAPGEIYHVFNRSVAKQPIFIRQKDYSRALELINYYSYQKPTLRFSHYNRLPSEQKILFWNNLIKNHQKQIQILVFCLMPNHFHFLIKEMTEGGISNFIRNFQNSYAKYFNTRAERTGAVFQSMFKAVRIESEEQLMHVCRYIHLNPLTSFVIKDKKDLENYNWSSYPFYIKKLNDTEILDLSFILGLFSSLKNFVNFTLDQVDYQRKLDQIKHLLLEN